jgi:hypothetical protein
VYAADAMTSPSTAPTITAAPSIYDPNWVSTLGEVQESNPAYDVPEPPDKDMVASLLEEAGGDTQTERVSRSLLINLTNASAQGLGGDIPTQDRLVEEALREVELTPAAILYSQGDLSIAEDSPASLRQYGNAVMSALQRHPRASYRDTLLAISNAADPTTFSQLETIGEAYAAAAEDLAAVSVPRSIAPLHLSIANNLQKIAATYTDMEALLADPLRGMSALQQYEFLMDETARMFTNVAQALQQGGILFTESEPGHGWSAFLSSV